jgi:hypothetical protein
MSGAALCLFPSPAASPRQVGGRIRQTQIKRVGARHIHDAGQKGIPTGGQRGRNGIIVGDRGAQCQVFVDLGPVQPDPNLVICTEQDGYLFLFRAIGGRVGRAGFL